MGEAQYPAKEQDTIDQEHYEPFDRLNAFINAIVFRKKGRGLVNSATDDLIDAMSHHFRNEEAILERCCYADLEEHRMKH